jgi:hypothetical protein
MTAFAWRQFRSQATVGIAGLVIVAIVLAATGPHLVSVYDTAVAACNASGGQSSACNNPVTSTFHGLQIALTALLLVVPALVGMFWGAPLIAHEIETGTFRLAWTQSISRLRWVLVKLGVVGLASMVAAAGLSLMATWWLSPIDKVNQNRFGPFNFGVHGFVPGGYAVFAFALGATVGLLMRRTVPAMAVTLAGFIGARLAVTDWLRPHFMSPATVSLPLSANNAGFQIDGPVGSGATVVPSTPNLPNAWVSSANIVDRAGLAPTSGDIAHACPNLSAALPGAGGGVARHGAGVGGHSAVSVGMKGEVQQAFSQCLTVLNTKYHEVVTYQPANRFWTFQAIETAVFVVLAGALAAGCVWWVRHRVS